eukprot:Pompholyxophrys_punicea_v1_NODE_351_length_2184_cov_8.490841.p3 type:complete len:102 gc:universal NODE_351_length_2184_cov_8.490841:621-926(+)
MFEGITERFFFEDRSQGIHVFWEDFANSTDRVAARICQDAESLSINHGQLVDVMDVNAYVFYHNGHIFSCVHFFSDALSQFLRQFLCFFCKNKSQRTTKTG